MRHAGHKGFLPLNAFVFTDLPHAEQFIVGVLGRGGGVPLRCPPLWLRPPLPASPRARALPGMVGGFAWPQVGVSAPCGSTLKDRTQMQRCPPRSQRASARSLEETETEGRLVSQGKDEDSGIHARKGSLPLPSRVHTPAPGCLQHRSRIDRGRHTDEVRWPAGARAHACSQRRPVSHR